MCVCVYLTTQECFVSGEGLLSHLLLVQKLLTHTHTHVQPHKHVHTNLQQKEKKKKWLQQKTRQGPKSPPSQAACPLVIARGIGSPLKRLRACVHVFKRQCYVSACHLWALALRFSPTLAPFLSFSFCLSGVEKYRRGAQWPRPGRLLCLAVGV